MIGTEPRHYFPYDQQHTCTSTDASNCFHDTSTSIYGALTFEMGDIKGATYIKLYI